MQFLRGKYTNKRLIVLLIIATIGFGFFGLAISIYGANLLNVSITTLYLGLWLWAYKSAKEQQSFLIFSFIFWLVSCTYFIILYLFTLTQIDIPFNFLLLAFWFGGPLAGIDYFFNDAWKIMGIVSGLVSIGSLFTYTYNLIRYRKQLRKR